MPTALPPQKWLCLSPSENAIHRRGRVWILNGMALHTHSHTLEYFCKHIIWCNFTAHSWWSVSELGYFMNIKNFGCFSQDNIYSKLYSSSMGQLACWNLHSGTCSTATKDMRSERAQSPLGFWSFNMEAVIVRSLSGFVLLLLLFLGVILSHAVGKCNLCISSCTSSKSNSYFAAKQCFLR